MKSAIIGLFALGGVEARDRMLRKNSRNYNKTNKDDNKAVQAEDVMFWMRDLQMGR